MAASISSIASTAGISSFDDTQSRIPTQVLGQEDFLKLLVAQLSAQDPMNPKKDTDFIAQMAQFSTLEQSKGMQSSLIALKSQQDLLQANALLGREVNLQIDKDKSVTGVISAVNIEAGTPKIVVNGTAYDMSKLYSVSLAEPEIETPTETATQ
jgi:flagellar basal-body rod modification protein FlgD